MPSLRGYQRRLASIFHGLFSSAAQPTTLSGNPRAGTLVQSGLFYEGLEVPDVVLRPIMGRYSTAEELLESNYWSYERGGAIAAAVRDVFQEPSGRTGSWQIAPSEAMAAEGVELDADTVAIATALANKRNGKDLILGGDALKPYAREFLGLGDSFMELGFAKDGPGLRDWGISSAQVLPSLSMFCEDARVESGGLVRAYWQQDRRGNNCDRTYFHPASILHFCYQKKRLYGQSLSGLESLPYWPKVKATARDLEMAARTVAVNPFLHIAPQGWDEQQIRAYEAKMRERLSQGIISHLFLSNGMDVRRAVGSVPSLAPITETWLNMRKLMIPPGVPLWLFPGLELQGRSSGQDLQGQPALVYSRLIADIRATLGEQIRWAIMIELVLKRGYDWLFADPRRYQFDIAWPKWAVTAGDEMLMTAADLREEDEPQDEAATVERLRQRLRLFSQGSTYADAPRIEAVRSELSALMAGTASDAIADQCHKLIHQVDGRQG